MLKRPGIPLETKQTFTAALQKQQSDFAEAGVPKISEVNTAIKNKLRNALKAGSPLNLLLTIP